MKTLKQIPYRYGFILLTSIFFTLSVQSQNSEAITLRDSIFGVKEFPDEEGMISIFQRLKSLAIVEANRDIELFSNIYLSHYNGVLGRQIESFKATEEAFQIAQDTSGLNMNDVITAYQLMQNLQRTKGNLLEENKINKQYIDLELNNGANDVQMGISYLELAAGYRVFGDSENTILYSTKSFDLFKNAPDSLFTKKRDKNNRMFRALQIRGLMYKDLKEYDLAIKDYTESLTYLEKSKQYEEKDGIRSRINCFGRMTDVYLFQKDFENARRTLKKLEPFAKTEKFNRFRFYELSMSLELKSNSVPSSDAFIKLALEHVNEQYKGDRTHPEQARIYMIYGDYYTAKNELKNALQEYQNGLRYFDGNLSENYSENPDLSKITQGTQSMQLLVKKANTLFALYDQTNDSNDLNSSIAAFNSAIDLMDKMKTNFINEGSKYKVAEIASTIYEDALKANYSAYVRSNDASVLENMLNIIEKNKAEILFQNVSTKYTLLSSSLPDSLINQGINIRKNISFYSKLIAEESQKVKQNAENLATLKNKLFEFQNSLTLYEQKLEENYPEFYAFKNSLSTQVTYQEIQQRLQEDHLLLEYFQTESKMFVFSVSNDEALVRTIPLQSLLANVSEFYLAISQKPGGKNNRLFDLSIALGKILITDNSNYQAHPSKIIIIPDGILNKIPFDVLHVDTENMVLESTAVSYNYSANQYYKNQNEAQLSNPTVLCLTPAFSGLSIDQRSCNYQVLGDLPNTQKEFDFLKDQFEGTFLDNDEANSENLKKNFSNHQIVHLATHACLNEEDPMLSQIYFSDGALTNYDIQNLNSRPELVVLSACNTASGLIQDGEGVIGLSRGFFEAGVKGLQSSLWSIDDYSSSEIVNGMYHHLKKGKSKSEALRLSKLDYLKKADKLRSHPYYWAALIHIGNDNPIDFSNYTSLAFILLFFTLFIIFIIVRNKKNRA